jgi:hypothetical protein
VCAGRRACPRMMVCSGCVLRSRLPPCRVVDDLYELQAFLAQRAAELGSGAGEALSASLPQAVQVRRSAHDSLTGGTVHAAWMHQDRQPRSGCMPA